MELAQKITKLKALQSTPGGMNELFYQARNLAIEALLLRLENRLLRSGFPAICVWNESSFGDPCIHIQLPNPKQDASWDVATCTLRVLRSNETAPDFVSSCVYVEKGFSGNSTGEASSLPRSSRSARPSPPCTTPGTWPQR